MSTDRCMYTRTIYQSTIYCYFFKNHNTSITAGERRLTWALWNMGLFFLSHIKLKLAMHLHCGSLCKLQIWTTLISFIHLKINVIWNHIIVDRARTLLLYKVLYGYWKCAYSKHFGLFSKCWENYTGRLLNLISFEEISHRDYMICAWKNEDKQWSISSTLSNSY